MVYHPRLTISIWVFQAVLGLGLLISCARVVAETSLIAVIPKPHKVLPGRVPSC